MLKFTQQFSQACFNGKTIWSKRPLSFSSEYLKALPRKFLLLLALFVCLLQNRPNSQSQSPFVRGACQIQAPADLQIESEFETASGLVTLVGNDVHVNAKTNTHTKEFELFTAEDPLDPAASCPITYELCDPTDYGVSGSCGPVAYTGPYSTPKLYIAGGPKLNVIIASNEYALATPGGVGFTLKGKLTADNSVYAVKLINVYVFVNCGGVAINPVYGPAQVTYRVNDQSLSQLPAVVWDGGYTLADTVKDAACPLTTSFDDVVLVDVNQPNQMQSVSFISTYSENPSGSTYCNPWWGYCNVALIQPTDNTEVQTFDIDGNVDCDLSVQGTKECTFGYEVRFRTTGYNSTDSTSGRFIHGTMTIQNECMELQPTLNLQPGFWTWNQLNFDKGYEVRDPTLTFNLPYLQPTLVSGKPLETYCGALKIDITNPDSSIFTDITDWSNGNAEPVFEIYTIDDLKASLVAPHEETYTFILSVEVIPYGTDLVWPAIHTLDFIVRDYCLGLTYSTPTFKVINPFTIHASNTIETAQDNLSFDKFVRYPRTDFLYEYHTYTQFRKNPLTDPPIQTKCGTIIYSFDIGPKDFDKEHETVWYRPGEDKDHYLQQGMRFHSYPCCSFLEGQFTATIHLKVSDVPHAPQRDIFIDIEVLPCVIQAMYPGPQFGLTDFEYLIDNGPQYLSLDLFEQFPACNYTTDYNYALMPQASSRKPTYRAGFDGLFPGDIPPVVVDKLKKRVIVETEELVYDQKTYAIFITATPEVTEYQDPLIGVAAPFTVNFVTNESLKVNFPPTIKGFISDFYIDAKKQSKINVGQMIDPNDLDSVYLSNWVAIFDGQTIPPEWVSFDNITTSMSQKVTFMVYPPESSEGKEIQIKFTLIDSAPVWKRKSADFTVNVYINDQVIGVDISGDDQRFTDKELVVVQILKSPNQFGLFTISFSKPITMFSDILEWKDTNAGSEKIKITYKPSEYTQQMLEGTPGGQRLQWKVLEVLDIAGRQLEIPGKRKLSSASKTTAYFQVSQIQIQLIFDQIDMVSPNTAFYDSISVQIQNELFFDDPNQFKLVQTEQPKFIFTETVPRQISQAELEQIQTAINSVDATIKAFMSANIGLSIFLSGVLNQLWSLVNTVQIIVITYMFSILMPVNAELLLLSLMKLTNLDIISTEVAINWIFKFPPTDPLNDRFNRAGYESSNFFIELGPLLFIISGFFLIMLPVRFILLKVLTCLPDSYIKRKLTKNMQIKMTVLRFLLEGCIELGISYMLCVLQVQTRNNFDHFWEGVSTVSAFVALLLSFATPIYLYYVVQKYHADPTSEQNKKEFAQLFTELKLNRQALLVSVVFLARRMLMVYVITILPKARNVQINIMLVSSLLVMGYTTYVKPYVSRKANLQETLNEVNVVLASYHLFCFTEFVYDPYWRSKIGYSLITLIIVNIIYNCAMMSVTIVKEIKRETKKRYHQYLVYLDKREKRRQQESWVALEKRGLYPQLKFLNQQGVRTHNVPGELHAIMQAKVDLKTRQTGMSSGAFGGVSAVSADMGKQSSSIYSSQKSKIQPFRRDQKAGQKKVRASPIFSVALYHKRKEEEKQNGQAVISKISEEAISEEISEDILESRPEMTDGELLHKDNKSLLFGGDGIDLLEDDKTNLKDLVNLDAKMKSCQPYDDREDKGRIFVRAEGTPDQLYDDDYSNLNKFEVTQRKPESPLERKKKVGGIHSIISHQFMKQINEESYSQSQNTSLKSSSQSEETVHQQIAISNQLYHNKPVEYSQNQNAVEPKFLRNNQGLDNFYNDFESRTALSNGVDLYERMKNLAQDKEQHLRSKTTQLRGLNQQSPNSFYMQESLTNRLESIQNVDFMGKNSRNDQSDLDPRFRAKTQTQLWNYDSQNKAQMLQSWQQKESSYPQANSDKGKNTPKHKSFTYRNAFDKSEIESSSREEQKSLENYDNRTSQEIYQDFFQPKDYIQTRDQKYTDLINIRARPYQPYSSTLQLSDSDQKFYQKEEDPNSIRNLIKNSSTYDSQKQF